VAEPVAPMAGLLRRPPAVRGDLARVVAGMPPLAPVRAEIVESWRRAAAHGLRPDRIEPPYDEGQPQSWSAAVTSALGDDLAGTDMSILVADQDGRITMRWSADRASERRLDAMLLCPGFVWSEEHVGTSGIGTALYRRSTTLVGGDEHFSDRLTTIACAGAPVVEDGTGRVLGVIAIIRRARHIDVLMTVVACQAARQIERHLGAHLSARQRLLGDHFARARQHARSAIAVVSPDTMLMNPSAARLLSPDDRAALWEWSLLMAGGDARRAPLRLRSGVGLEATFDPVHAGQELVGALVRIVDVDRATTRPRSRPPGSAARFGWPSLTDAELGVADRVAAGRTNREVAAELFLSPHTVDSHLRHIYTKLGIASRVQLTRLLMSRDGPEASATIP
jgi:DNA-binding CsgD family transcriptional regulator